MIKWNVGAVCLMLGAGAWVLNADEKDAPPDVDVQVSGQAIIVGPDGQTIVEEIGPDGVVDLLDGVAEELNQNGPQDPGQRRQAWQDRIRDMQKRMQERQELRAYDEDNDGKLSEEEKAKMAADKAAKEKAEKEKLDAAKKKFFKTYDTDKSGTLTADEMEAAKKKLAAMIEHLNMVVTADKAVRRDKETILAPLVSQIRSGLKVQPAVRSGQFWRSAGRR